MQETLKKAGTRHSRKIHTRYAQLFRLGSADKTPLRGHKPLQSFLPPFICHALIVTLFDTIKAQMVIRLRENALTQTTNDTAALSALAGWNKTG